MNASILTIGDEILIGSTLDSNSRAIARALVREGIHIAGMRTVADTADGIRSGVEEGLTEADVVLVTGGLGPTRDDITKQTLAELFDSELSLDEHQLERLKKHFTRRGKDVLELNEKLAWMPVEADVLPNERGTALGMWFERDGQVVVSMPGVPHEMESMLTHHVVPRLVAHFDVAKRTHRFVMCAGMGESTIATRIDDIIDAMPEGVSIAFLPSLGQVKLRFTAGPEVEDAARVLDDIARSVEERLPRNVYAHREVDIEEVVGEMLLERGLTIGLAESCTGGYVAHRITSVPGSSRYYEGSVVMYSYRLKTEVLGVDPDVLEEHGAVSEPVVEQMVRGVIDRLGVDTGISISGIAGPGGGLPDKPVGTVWVSVSVGDRVHSHRYQLTPHRMENIRITGVVALNQLRCLLLGLEG